MGRSYTSSDDLPFWFKIAILLVVGAAMAFCNRSAAALLGFLAVLALCIALVAFFEFTEGHKRRRKARDESSSTIPPTFAQLIQKLDKEEEARIQEELRKTQIAPSSDNCGCPLRANYKKPPPS